MIGKRSIAAAPAESDIADMNANVDAGAAADGKSLLGEHKGKLALGVAATLGIMIYYNWREKKLAKTDPEGHARLQRLKTSVIAKEAGSRQQTQEKSAKPQPSDSKSRNDNDAVVG